MMPWQLARDLIRVREAELSRRARAAARQTRDHDGPPEKEDASRPARTGGVRIYRRIWGVAARRTAQRLSSTWVRPGS